MDTATLVDVLDGSSFLRGLAAPERRRLAPLAQREVAAPGQVLLREGAETEALGIVVSGRVALRLSVPERGPITVLTVEAGDLYGWSAVVSPYRSTSTAVAIEPTTAVVFPARPLRDALNADEELAASVYPRILASVARRLEATRLQLLDVFGRDVDSAW
jgi:CRP/FNR family transcriptional regulator, cyclic AMP receptor protein